MSRSSSAAAPLRLGLGRVHQQRADPLAAPVLDHDEAGDVALPARGVDRDAADDSPVDLGDQHDPGPAVHHRRELRVVLAGRAADLGVRQVLLGRDPDDDLGHSGR